MYPVVNESRDVISLCGIWDFRFRGDNTWQHVYVPGSFNNQLNDSRARYWCGKVEYRTKFCIPASQKGRRAFLRFDGVAHNAQVFIDGVPVTEHRGGFLPFETEITELDYCISHELIVVADNRIDNTTFPVGNESGTAFFGSDNPGVPSVENQKKVLEKSYNLPNFDFFNYCGINRPVRIYTTPAEYISDVDIVPVPVSDSEAVVKYRIQVCGTDDAEIEIIDEEGSSVARGRGLSGELIVKDPHLWNPAPGKPYMYKAHVSSGNDSYDLSFGIRKIEVSGSRVLINGKPFYFKGAGRHEDSVFRGRGLDQCVNVKDISLLHWINANCIRTSHYPDAEELYSLCDSEGIVVIDELPAVGLNFGDRINPYKSKETLEYHSILLDSLIKRDSMHPCVVMWSLGNEPDTEHFPEDAYEYWQSLYRRAHEKDPQNRPVTVVCNQNNYTRDITAPSMDIVCINRYYGWYNLSGCLDNAYCAFQEELDFWEKIGKPLILTEYGADSISGMHSVFPEMFTEEFQAEYLKVINSCLDSRTFVAGEMPWVFADFDTQQGPMRACGNHKGLFTRDRQPKMAAHYLRERWKDK